MPQLIKHAHKQTEVNEKDLHAGRQIIHVVEDQLIVIAIKQLRLEDGEHADFGNSCCYEDPHEKLSLSYAITAELEPAKHSEKADEHPGQNTHIEVSTDHLFRELVYDKGQLTDGDNCTQVNGHSS